MGGDWRWERGRGACVGGSGCSGDAPWSEKLSFEASPE